MQRSLVTMSRPPDVDELFVLADHVQRLVDLAVEQGFGPTVQDAGALRRVADLIGAQVAPVNAVPPMRRDATMPRRNGASSTISNRSDVSGSTVSVLCRSGRRWAT